VTIGIEIRWLFIEILLLNGASSSTQWLEENPLMMSILSNTISGSFNWRFQLAVMAENFNEVP
jgi:hypothetical protein